MMSEEQEATVKRIHIGNISPKLAENVELFTKRLEKFGSLESTLELHTKPVNDFYFGFINIKQTDKDFEKLKASLNGILFMGKKLTISLSKPNFKENWLADSKRPDSKKMERVNRDRIARAREERILESRTLLSQNKLTGGLVHSTYIGPNNSGYGFAKSCHVYNNNEANTKNKAPSSSLKGLDSYGSLTSSSKISTNQYSNSSGGSEVIKGRHRITPRPNIYFLKKQQTLRININGELKTLKCYKTKLWGLEKNKTSKDLTYKFQNGVWKSGDDHIIERVNKNKLSSFDLEVKSSDPKDPDEEDESSKQERMKNNSILASLFNKYDFDKPLDIEEDNGIDSKDISYDSKGRRTVKTYDYEMEGDLLNEESDSDASFDYNQIQAYKESHERPKDEVYFDEEDEGNDLDLDNLGQQYTTEAINNKYNEDHGFEVVLKPDQDNSKDEFIPSFGNQPENVNNTETLRSLFNPGQQEKPEATGFKLSLDDDDIDESNNILNEEEQSKLLEQIKEKQKEQQTNELMSMKNAKKKGLFWPHFDSPFLQTQSQLNRIGNANEMVKLPGEDENLAQDNDEESAYEKWFWSKRGELMRECRRRKRDVNRIFKKKHTKAIL